ncbi:beta-1 adrenergic receptor-like [Ctenocephalides felis]|nr:beta-1 adrenergic receptor-like [Ctenocephalides felis]
MCWLPFGACFVPEPNLVPDSALYNTAWLAYSRSCLNPLLYCALDGRFRNAYVNLFHYCCCKTTVSFSRRQRGCGSNSGAGDSRGGMESGLGRSGGDVRVHIIPGYNMYSYTSPQRPCRQNGRDVYEL